MVSPSRVRPFEMSPDGALRVLDQTRLPQEEVWIEVTTVEQAATAIETLQVRGAPAIGCVAALGLSVAASRFHREPARFRQQVGSAIERLRDTRPTAVNLFVALDQLKQAMLDAPPQTGTEQLCEILAKTAQDHVADDLRSCRTMGQHGARLLPDEGAVLTHCNAGALATAGYGTALGVIRAAREAGKKFTVLADETRPVLQGARLTAWELHKEGIPVEVIADNMAGALMARGEIQAAIVGADRIARNGDVANKIGTYTVAVLCKHHKIPLYVAAPWTTIDRSLATGAQIPIEQRAPSEIQRHGDRILTPSGVGVRNPAFDVTPSELVSAIITERGVHRPDEIATFDLGEARKSSEDR